MPFWNQRKCVCVGVGGGGGGGGRGGGRGGGNDRRKYSMIRSPRSPRKNVADPAGSNPQSPVGRVSS